MEHINFNCEQIVVRMMINGRLIKRAFCRVKFDVLINRTYRPNYLDSQLQKVSCISSKLDGYSKTEDVKVMLRWIEESRKWRECNLTQFSRRNWVKSPSFEDCKKIEITRLPILLFRSTMDCWWKNRVVSKLDGLILRKASPFGKQTIFMVFERRSMVTRARNDGNFASVTGIPSSSI